MIDQIETCHTSGHVWHQLFGGMRCDRCGEQRAIPVLAGHVANLHEMAILHEMNLVYLIIGNARLSIAESISCGETTASEVIALFGSKP